MFAADSARVAGNTKGCSVKHCLLLEFRNDRLVDKAWRARAVKCLADVITRELLDAGQ